MLFDLVSVFISRSKARLQVAACRGLQTAGGLQVQHGPAFRALQHRALAVSAQSGRTSPRGAHQPDQARTGPGFLYGDSLESWQPLI